MEQCGAMWSDVERCGTHNRDVERCRAMWDGRYNMYILAIRYDRIRPKFSFRGNNADGCPNVALAGVSSLSSSSLSSSRRGCKVCALPFWSGRMFYYLPIVPYILRCRAMSSNVDVTSPISCDVAQCGGIWRDVGL